MDEIARVPERATIIAATILDGKDHAEPPAVTPDSLLREPRHRRASSRLLPRCSQQWITHTTDQRHVAGHAPEVPRTP